MRRGFMFHMDRFVSDFALLIFYVALALVVSFVCSVLEAVLLSITPTYIVGLEAQESPMGAKLRGFKENIDKPLAAILSLNTVAHTVGASGAGAQALKVFDESYVAIIGAILTLLILVISEIIPKTLGARYWKRLAPLAGKVLSPLIILTYPLVLMSQGISSLMGGSAHGGPAMSRAEFQALADMGTKDGIFEEDESRILRNLFKLEALKVKDVMTPRTVMMTLDEKTTVREALEHPRLMRFSRIPVCQDRLDHISGFVLQQDLLLASARDEHDRTLGEFVRPLVFLPASAPLRGAFEELLKGQAHIALLVDDYGGTEGLVTMEDLVETLLGLEIVDERDATDDLQVMARQQWQKRAQRLGLLDDHSEEPDTEG
jgi:CBS domain containing-hemolysin-like protein